MSFCILDKCIKVPKDSKQKAQKSEVPFFHSKLKVCLSTSYSQFEITGQEDWRERQNLEYISVISSDAPFSLCGNQFHT